MLRVQSPERVCFVKICNSLLDSCSIPKDRVETTAPYYDGPSGPDFSFVCRRSYEEGSYLLR